MNNSILFDLLFVVSCYSCSKTKCKTKIEISLAISTGIPIILVKEKIDIQSLVADKKIKFLSK